MLPLSRSNVVRAYSTGTFSTSGIDFLDQSPRFDDWNRQFLIKPASVQGDQVFRSKSSSSQGPPSPVKISDVACSDKALEYALQVILNMQALDKQMLARAMLSPIDGTGGLDAKSLLRRLEEVGPRLLDSENKLRQDVLSLNKAATTDLLKEIGLDEEGIEASFARCPSLASLHEEIIQVLQEALPAESLADAISVTAERRLRHHLERRGVTRYSDNMTSLHHANEKWAKVWERIWLQYPSKPVLGTLAKGCEHRSELRVIIIGPGFGLLATPHMIDLVRSSGYQLLELPTIPNLEHEKNPAKIHAGVQELRAAVAKFQPHVIVAASKGGLYFPYLWREPDWEISCVLINAHPNITKLPEKATVVVTQGSRDETFKRIIERQTLYLDSESTRDKLVEATRYCPLRQSGDSPALVVQKKLQFTVRSANGKFETQTVPAGAVLKPQVKLVATSAFDPSSTGTSRLTNMDDLTNLKLPATISYRHGREDLEDLIRTGGRKKAFLYLSCSGITARPGKPESYTRLGDGHAAPQSLCNEDCLPRLIDAAASGKAEDTFHESWSLLAEQERSEGEIFLGNDPESLKRFWTGAERPGGLGRRFEVSPDSDEFMAIQQVFRANPDNKNYNFNNDWKGKRIVKIDRVQAPEQLEAVDAHYVSVQKSLERQGSNFVNGVHTRWLFHGSNAIDSIVSDPLSGFKVTLSKTSMWGMGIYFARDAQYPDDHGFFGEPRPDGTKDVLLCLVVTGMSVLGDESYAIQPYRHGSHHRYNSFVDTLSNPEIFVVSTPNAVFPAYVITYA